MPTWDPAQYLRHADHRTRAFADLLARVPEPRVPKDRPLRVADLGCGPGNSTRLLTERWPAARVTGYDHSEAMLARARTDLADTGADFAHADLRTWTPDEPYDVIASNATLQWVPGHPHRLADWTAALAPGGTLAFQVPGNFDAPSHALMRRLAASEGPWRKRLDGVLRGADAVLDPAGYLPYLTGPGRTTDLWETTYLHLLTGPDAVLDWVTGTGLRPVLDALADDRAARTAFTDAYRDLLREAYPVTADGTTPFPFRRVFAVTTVPTAPAAQEGP
ncbi:trans-aconitate methyltransferase [Streptomyces albidoflavus]|uniref:trans-aconitate 2-methyltransferase n=1 Tax=Streptomyces TaxID=1883 RepID=UPI00101E79B7|nr:MULTISPECIES: trans-aconitate 2-methyltransferase [Streptomyces]QHC17484.1 trans-aconitate 2-methyltransferase [Streptomyces sp. GF20]RZD63965.1 trans-aconitate methyltransferase [Streptomyces albidoflavus]